VDNSLSVRIFTEPQQGASYIDQLRLARFAEEAGFDAFFRSDHYLRMGGGDGGPGPSDSWIALAGLARDTESIRLGTLVTAATFRHPGPLAIAVAQVDQMSGGRVEFGFGSGWFAAEHTAYGIPFPATAELFERYAEQLEIITGLWATPVGRTYDFAGQHYTLTDSPALPKPAQHPRPPVIIGGKGKRRTPELAARYADEFNLPFTNAAESAAQFDRVDAACRAIGRDPATMIRSAAVAMCLGRDEAELATRADALGYDLAQLRSVAPGMGTVAEAAEKLRAYRETTGVTRLYLQTTDARDLGLVELIATELVPLLR
jgi:F420-dependent oxidoreductase-like protein